MQSLIQCKHNRLYSTWPPHLSLSLFFFSEQNSITTLIYPQVQSTLSPIHHALENHPHHALHIPTHPHLRSHTHTHTTRCMNKRLHIHQHQSILPQSLPSPLCTRNSSNLPLTPHALHTWGSTHTHITKSQIWYTPKTRRVSYRRPPPGSHLNSPT